MNIPDCPNHENAAEPQVAQGVMDGLAVLAPKTLVSEHALANAFCVSARTIRRMVSRHELPPPVRIAGRATWVVERILAHIDARAARAAQDAEREERRLKALLASASGASSQ